MKRTSDLMFELLAIRRANKGEWYWYKSEVEGMPVLVKGYGTWLQIFEINGIDCSNPMGQSVTAYTQWIDNAVESAKIKKAS